MQKSQKARLNALKRLYAGATYDQVTNDFKELKKLLRLQAPERKSRTKIKYIPPEEYRMIKAAIREFFPQRYTQLITDISLDLRLGTGIRINEMVNIKKEDINLSERTIRIRIGKGGKERFVVFSEEFRDRLQTYIYQLPANQDYLFESRTNGIPGGKYSTKAFQNNLKRLRDFASQKYDRDFSYLTSHVLRHTHLTEMAAAGMPPSALKAQSGHSRYSTLDENYFENNPLIQRQTYDAARRNLELKRLNN